MPPPAHSRKLVFDPEVVRTPERETLETISYRPQGSENFRFFGKKQEQGSKSFNPQFRLIVLSLILLG